MEWVWDEVKAISNMQKHRVSFELAVRVLDDPLMLSRTDPCPHEERWQTLGRPTNDTSLIILVIHTWPNEGYEGRIISARRATPRERKAYEEEQF